MSPCPFSASELAKVRDLMDAGFGRDRAVVALAQSGWDPDAAAARCLDEGGPSSPGVKVVPSGTTSQDVGVQAASQVHGEPPQHLSASVARCSKGCGRIARLVQCCRTCSSASGPHANCCISVVPSVVPPRPSGCGATGPPAEPGRDIPGSASSSAAPPWAGASSAAAGPAVPSGGGGGRRGYVVLATRVGGLLGWHRKATWGDIEKLVGARPKQLAGQLGAFGLELRRAADFETAEGLWHRWHPGDAMHIH